MSRRYPVDAVDPDTYEDDDGTMPSNVEALAEHVIGHRIVKAEKRSVAFGRDSYRYGSGEAFVITLDSGKEVALRDSSDCCAFTDLEAFLLHPERVDHIITGVETEGGFTKWHIYADLGDVLELAVGWSSGNPFYYGYGFDIEVLG